MRSISTRCIAILIFGWTLTVYAQSERVSPSTQGRSNDMSAVSSARSTEAQASPYRVNSRSTAPAGRGGQKIGKLSVISRNTVQGNVAAESDSTVSIGNTNIGSEINNSITGSAAGSITDQGIGRNVGLSRGSIAGPGLERISDSGNVSSTGSDAGNISDPSVENDAELATGEEIPYSLLLDNPEMRQFEQDYLYALMSQCSYGSEECTKSNRDTLEHGGWGIGQMVEPWGSTIEYQSFVNHNTKEIVVAFRGTEGGIFGNIIQFPANVKGAFSDNISGTNIPLSDAYVDAGYTLTYVGHSKGGGEAISAADNNPDSKAVVFNSRDQYFSTSDVFSEGRVRGYYVDGEALAFTRTWRNGYYQKFNSDKGAREIGAKHSMQTVIDEFEKILGIN